VKPAKDSGDIGATRGPADPRVPPNLEKTSPNIGLSLSNASLETAPGASADTLIRVQNLSTIVDRLHIRVDGLDPTWWTVSVPTLSFFPGDRGESRLTIRPPKEAEAIAGSYSFRVKVVSEANPEDESVVTAVLVLRGFVSCEVELSPAKATGRIGTYRINARNSGNTDAVLRLEGKDQEEALTFRFSRDKVTVPSGGTSQVELAVAPKKGGEQKKAYYFQVVSQNTGLSKETKVLSGQLDFVPGRNRWWLVPVIVGGAGVVLIVLGIIAGVYQQTESDWLVYYTTSTPFRKFMIPLFAIGGALVIAGATLARRNWKRATSQG
jgi:hypothetical protein